MSKNELEEAVAKELSKPFYNMRIPPEEKAVSLLTMLNNLTLKDGSRVRRVKPCSLEEYGGLAQKILPLGGK